MLKPICVPCRKFYRPERNGVYFTEGMPSGDTWTPYKVWVGDLFKCPECGHELLTGFGCRPIAEHYQDGFTDTRDRLGAAAITINDC